MFYLWMRTLLLYSAISVAKSLLASDDSGVTECGIEVKLTLAEAEAGVPPPSHPTVEVKLRNRNDFRVSYSTLEQQVYLRVVAVTPKTAWMPAPPELPLTDKAKRERERKIVYGKGRFQYPGSAWSYSIALKDLYDIQPGKYKVTAYVRRPGRVGNEPYIGCPAPVFIRSNEIEIEVPK